MSTTVESFKLSVREEAAKLSSFVESGDLENSVKCIMNLTSLATVASIYAESEQSDEAKEVALKTKSFTTGKALQSVVKKFGN